MGIVRTVGRYGHSRPQWPRVTCNQLPVALCGTCVFTLVNRVNGPKLVGAAGGRTLDDRDASRTLAGGGEAHGTERQPTGPCATTVMYTVSAAKSESSWLYGTGVTHAITIINDAKSQSLLRGRTKDCTKKCTQIGRNLMASFQFFFF